MKLITLHRILIATMIAFLCYFGWYQSQRWQRDGSVAALCIVVACALVAAALTWYLTHLKRYVNLDSPGAKEPK